MWRAVVLSGACWLLGNTAISGTVLYVDDDALPGGDGLTWITAYRFLQDALTAASIPGNDVNEIRVAQGVYRPDQDDEDPAGTRDQDATFAMIDEVALRGGYAGLGAPDPDARDVSLYESILSGQVASTCFTGFYINIDHVISSLNNSGATSIDGFSIECGQNSIPGGAGLYVLGGNLIVVDCVFRHNNTELGTGGAALTIGGNVALFNCLFTHNSSAVDSDASGIYSSASNVLLFNCGFAENFCENVIQNVNGTDVIIVGCTIHANDTVVCAGNIGIVNIDSKALIQNCAFMDNIDEGSGAMSNNGSIVDIVDCVFDSNHGHGTGAMFNHNSQISIHHCVFINNVGGDGVDAGGAVVNNSSDVTTVNCTFISNAAGSQQGGAIRNINTDAVIVNSTFSGNHAQVGAGIANNASNPTIVNCTFSGNGVAFGSTSGAMYSDVDSFPTLINCIAWNHDEPTFGGAGEITFSYSNIEEKMPPGIGNISADPLFVDADGPDDKPGTIDDNLRALPDSPCIDAGDNTAVPPDEFDLDNDGDTTEPIPFDLAGLPRIVDDPKTPDTGNGTPPIVDMGAYEFTGTVNPLDLTGDGVVDAADLAQLLADWGACPGCAADYTADGIVSAADLAELLANWG